MEEPARTFSTSSHGGISINHREAGSLSTKSIHRYYEMDAVLNRYHLVAIERGEKNCLNSENELVYTSLLRVSIVPVSRSGSFLENKS